MSYGITNKCVNVELWGFLTTYDPPIANYLQTTTFFTGMSPVMQNYLTDMVASII